MPYQALVKCLLVVMSGHQLEAYSFLIKLNVNEFEIIIELPKSEVIPSISVHHIFQMIRWVEELAILSLTGTFLYIIIAGYHAVAAQICY